MVLVHGCSLGNGVGFVEHDKDLGIGFGLLDLDVGLGFRSRIEKPFLHILSQCDINPYAMINPRTSSIPTIFAMTTRTMNIWHDDNHVNTSNLYDG